MLLLLSEYRTDRPISNHIYKYHNLIFLLVDNAGCLILSCVDKAMVTRRIKNREVILPSCYIF